MDVEDRTHPYSTSKIENLMAKPALPWLKKLCALYLRHESSVYGCSAEPHVSGVLIRLELDRGTMYLLAHPKARSSSYAETASMSISIHQPEGAGPIPGNGELVARQFINILQRADKGNIFITGNCTRGHQPETQISQVSPSEAKAAREAAKGEIQWAAFLGFQNLMAKTPLMAPEDDEVESRHRYLVDHFETGFDRSEFKSRFGVDAAEVVREPFEKLISMGLVSMDGNTVHTHATAPEDTHVFRVFLYSDKQHSRAKDTWGHEYDPGVDYVAEIRRLTRG